MSNRMTHLPDEDLLLCLDGELAARRGAVDAHLAGCDACRSRLARLEAASQAIRQTLTSGSGPSLAARRRLTVAMRQDAEQWHAGSGVGRLLARLPIQARWALGAAAALACAVWLGSPGMRADHASRVAPSMYARPIVSLTPGATWDISRAEVCGTGAPDVTVVAERVRHAVVAAYGMADVPDSEYELDYLITPELGGAPDASNLWPQRYDVPGWNARVKDQLERLLPTLVCAGRVDLATAQHEMATDWIAAYRKYFHSDVPLPPSATDLRDDDALAFAALDEPYRLAEAPRARILVLHVRAAAPKAARISRQRT